MLIDKILLEAGREMGDSFVLEVHNNASTPDEYHSGMIALQIACLHVLTLCAFNCDVAGKNGKEMVSGFEKQMQQDLVEYHAAHKRGESKLYEKDMKKNKKTPSYDA